VSGKVSGSQGHYGQDFAEGLPSLLFSDGTPAFGRSFSFADHNHPLIDFPSVQGTYGLLSFFGCRHFDKSKSQRAATEFVLDDVYRSDPAIWLKQLSQLIFGCFR